MKSLLIAWNDFSIRMKDRRGIILMLVMPLLLTAILGAALKNVFGANAEFPETIVGISMDASDQLSKDFYEVLKDTPFIKIKNATKLEKLQDMMKDGEIDVAVVLPSNWSEGFNEGMLREAEVLTNSEKQLKASVIISILESFINRSMAISTTAGIVGDNLATTNYTESVEAVMAVVQDAGRQEIIINEKSVGEKSVSAMQYYTAAMAAMFLLFNITVGAKSIAQERETNTLNRLRGAPIRSRSIILGKFYGTFLFACIQFFLFYLATSLFFKVYWGDNVLQIFTIGLVYATAVAGLSMVLAAFITRQKILDVISGVGIQICALIGGSMLPLSQFPEIMKNISQLTPNHWALTSLLDIMSGVTWVALLLPISVLLMIGIFSLIIGTLRLESGYRSGAK